MTTLDYKLEKSESKRNALLLGGGVANFLRADPVGQLLGLESGLMFLSYYVTDMIPDTPIKSLLSSSVRAMTGILGTVGVLRGGYELYFGLKFQDAKIISNGLTTLLSGVGQFMAIYQDKKTDYSLNKA